VNTAVIVALIVLAIVVVAAIVLLVLRRRSRPPAAGAPSAAPSAAPSVPAPARRRSLGDRLAKTRHAIGGRLAAMRGRDHLDDAYWEGMEEALVAADVGVATATEVVEEVKESNPDTTAEAEHALRDGLVARFGDRDRTLSVDGAPGVLVVVGVNGSGKTTTVAKLAAQLQAGGHTTRLGAADTFRAAADEQLRTWADRVGVEVVGGQEGADPAAVAFDAYQAARARGRDVVLVDTAGRLHSKTNLMQELGKVERVLAREAGELNEVLLVLDGTTGQNAISQARTFTEVVGVSGIILTKLDGSARGGVAVAVEHDLDIPVKYIGVGEGVDDLIPFVPGDFVDALLEDET
jgi:fused signal recognition particle receptor